MITPNTEVQIYNFNNEVKPVKLITLTAWNVALKAEVQGVQVAPQLVEPIVRKFLECPKDYPLTEIQKHIQTSLTDIQQQLGIKNETNHE